MKLSVFGEDSSILALQTYMQKWLGYRPGTIRGCIQATVHNNRTNELFRCSMFLWPLVREQCPDAVSWSNQRSNIAVRWVHVLWAVGHRRKLVVFPIQTRRRPIHLTFPVTTCHFAKMAADDSFALRATMRRHAFPVWVHFCSNISPGIRRWIFISL